MNKTTLLQKFAPQDIPTPHKQLKQFLQPLNDAPAHCCNLLDFKRRKPLIQLIFTNAQISKLDILEAGLLDSEVKEWLTTSPQTYSTRIRKQLQ